MADEETPVDSTDPLTGADASEETVELLGQDGEGESGKPDAQPTGDEDQLKKEEPKAEGHRSALQKLIDEKYQGDESKFVEGLHNQWNSAADLAKTLKEVRQELADLKAGKATKEEPETDDDPDLASLNDQRALVAQELEDLRESANLILKDYNQMSRDLAKAEAYAEKSDDFEKTKWEQKVEELKEKMASAERAYKRLPSEERKISLQLKGIDSAISRAKGNLKSRSEAQKAKAAEDERIQAEFRSTIDNLISLAHKDHNLDSGSRSARGLAEYVRRSLIAHLSTLEPDAPGVDPVLAVKHFSDEYMELLRESGQATFKQTSQKKAAAMSPTAAPQKPTPGGGKPVKVRELTKEQIEAHHKAVFGL